MAKFTLMVETEDSAEIAHIANAINGADPVKQDVGLPANEARPTLDAQTAAPKTRAKKGSATDASSASVAETSGTTAAAEPAIEEIETVKGITAEDLMDPPAAPTFEEVKAAMLDLIEKKDADQAKKILVANGVTGRLGEAPKEKYPALLAAFQAA